ncbi:serine/threonine-protein kinase rio2-like isoform X1 [Ostrea edulis]|uniref:serine/threonine-protein kinase rio2-like isoform X1 n=1 Tax=Ostrea edulis TaxID=37623 RepID=UPI0024AF6B23|nr:serine/threonine-protein kinase rio2-like isoform X1 [Ostrea edulis]
MADRKRRDSAVESDLLQKRFRADSNSKDDGEGDDDDDDDDDGEEEEEEEEDNVTNIYCQLSEYDQAILLHVLTGNDVIYFRKIDIGKFHKYLEKNRSLCDMDSRPVEEDIRSIKSMTDKGDVLKWDEEKVEFSSPEVRDRIIEEFAGIVRTDGEYLMLSRIIENNWRDPKSEGIRKRIIQNIMQPFVWRKGLDFIDYVTEGWFFPHGCSVITEIRK